MVFLGGAVLANLVSIVPYIHVVLLFSTFADFFFSSRKESPCGYQRQTGKNKEHGHWRSFQDKSAHMLLVVVVRSSRFCFSGSDHHIFHSFQTFHYKKKKRKMSIASRLDARIRSLTRHRRRPPGLGLTLPISWLSPLALRGKYSTIKARKQQ